MTYREVLELLQEVVSGAQHSYTSPDDYSGVNTRYYVDQEQLLRNIAERLEATCEHCGKYLGRHVSICTECDKLCD